MKLLYLDCCITMRTSSHTKQLAETFLKSWHKLHPSDEIEHLDLKSMSLFPLDEVSLHEREQAAANKDWNHPSLALARQFAQADRIVVAAPFWEMTFPAKLQTYLEHISVCGITFRYTPSGSEGLCRARKFLYFTTAGGPIDGCNFGSNYLHALSQFYGISEYHFIGAPMQDIQEIDTTPYLNEALQQAETIAKTF